MINRDDYRTLGESYFAHVLVLVKQRVEGYNLRIEIAPLPESSAADFDGLTVVLKPELSTDAALFYLLHVFGHTVQWCTSEEALAVARRLIVPGQPLPDDELQTIMVYEREASEYSLQLLHELGVGNLDQWVSDLWAWDWDYLKGVYINNAPAYPKTSFDYAQIPFGQPCLQARPIPEFVPQYFGMASVI